jgi:hypothetical protein
MQEFMNTFLDACEFRIQEENEQARQRKNVLCKKIQDDHGGLKVGVRPQMCAQCQLKGGIDEEFLKGLVARILRQMTQNAKLGFFRNDQETAQLAFDQSFVVFGEDPDMVSMLKTMMAEAVQYGNLEHDRAVAVAEKHSLED